MPSTVIDSFAFNERRNELTVKFVGDKRYAYSLVPSAVYVEFCKAGSKGRFFNREIRDRYPMRRLGPGNRPRPDDPVPA